MPTYSLLLFRHLLDQRPAGLPDDIQERGEQAYKRLAEEESDLQAVESELLDYGKKTWAYRQAEEMFEQDVFPDKRETFFLSFLPDELKEKWKAFVSKGGSMHDFRHGESFEKFFTPEENIVLEEAMVETDELVHEYINRVAREEKKEQFEQALARARERQHQIEEKIEELRSLIPKEGKKWDQEIQEAVLFFERGLADIEERPAVEKVQGKIDWYRGQMEAGNA